MNKIQFFGLRYKTLQLCYKTLQVVTCNASLPGTLPEIVSYISYYVNLPDS